MLKYLKIFLQRKAVLNASVGSAFLFMFIGIIFWGGFNTALEVTNSMEFCISCHEMERNVFQEYTHTVHYSNRTGVQASCPDCHVPKEWQHMVVRKIYASRELFHKVMGTINSTEKFEEHRERMAQSVWQSMEKTNSRECRNCHSFKSMNAANQTSRSSLIHTFAQEQQKTCINCHKGIAHKLPAGVVTYRGGSNEDHVIFKEKNIPCYSCHEDIPKPDTEEWDWELD